MGSESAGSEAVSAAAAATARPRRAVRRRVAVVGGGVAGLAAARRAALDGCEVTLLESGPRTGGKLALGAVAGVQVDLGAESILARRPEGVRLAGEIGLADDIVHPAVTAAGVFSRGELHPLPGGQLMGIPGDLRALAASGILSTSALARVRADRLLPRTPITGDVSVGDYVARRLGREVVDRLVEPLLGGVYAGHADRLSLSATVPQLVPLAESGGSLSAGVRDLLDNGAASRSAGGPVFAGIRGGVGRLPVVLEADARRHGVDVRLGVGARRLARGAADSADSAESMSAGFGRAAWTLGLSDGSTLDVDGVVFATPAFATADLLAGAAPQAASELRGIDYASVAIVTFAFPRAAIGDEGLPGSGFLVPPVDGRAIKASTFSTSKWPWLAHAAGNLVILRASLGRHGEHADLDRDDADLAKVALGDLSDAVHLGAAPVDTHVQRWNESLPQYAVGHLDRVARVRAALPAGLAVAGGAYDGVGIPACIASAEKAVGTLREGFETL